MKHFRDEQILQLMLERKIPGLAIRLLDSGKILYSGEFGYAKPIEKKLVQSQTPFRVGCITKPVIALAILILVEEKLLSLEDKLILHLPCLAKATNFENITIHQLLTHQSGLPRGIYFERPPDDEELIRIISCCKLIFIPGTSYKYSNWGYVLLRMICEKISATPIDHFCKAKLFEPLGMRNTYFLKNDNSLNDEITGYWQGWHFGYPDFSCPIEPAKSYWIGSGAADLVSTPEDMVHLIRVFSTSANLQKALGISIELANRVFTKIADKTSAKFMSICLYGEQNRGLGYWYFPGTSSGFSAMLITIPDLNLSAVALANKMACNTDLKEVLEMLILAHYPELPENCLRDVPESLDMRFTAPDGKILKLHIKNTQTVMQLGEEKIPLLFNTSRKYYLSNGSLRHYMLRLHTRENRIYKATLGNISFHCREKSSSCNEKILDNIHTGFYEYPPFGRVELLHRADKLYLLYGVVYESLLLPVGTNKYRQKKGPFAGEILEFGDLNPQTQQYDSFLLNQMKFTRLNEESIPK